MYDRGNIVVVGQVHGPNNWGMSLRLGVKVNLVDTGSGHALLAFQSPARRTEMLGEHEVLEGEVLLPEAELERLLVIVRDRGYWQGDSQQCHGVVDISMPILGPQGDAMAVLTCPFIRRIDRHVGASVDEARALLQAAAEQLSLAGIPRSRPSSLG